MEKIKVLIVDNSVLARRILAEAVNATEFAYTEQTASTGIIARERLKQRHFDIVLLSLSLTDADSLDILAVLQKEFPEAAVFMTGTEAELTEQGTKARAIGAAGFISKPSSLFKLEGSAEELTRQFSLAFSHLNAAKYPAAFYLGESSAAKQIGEKEKRLYGREQRRQHKPPKGIDLVVIASSTGGPLALEKTCIPLAAGFKCPILVVQHMPADFTRIMATSLNARAHLQVVEGTDGHPVRTGEIIIAPGGVHMTVKNIEGFNYIKTNLEPNVNGVRPAADVLFSSVAKSYKGAKVLAVILTGMGNDGTEGVRELKKNCYCYCLIQSEKTCVVYGMPRSVYEAGLEDEVVDIDDMAARIQQLAARS